MTDDLVKRICQTWIDDGRADECFWEGWPKCPTPEDRLTPRMVLDRIEELEAKRLANRAAIMRLEAKLAKALEALGEAIYLLDPDEEDIAKGTGLYRIVTTYKELTGGKDAPDV